MTTYNIVIFPPLYLFYIYPHTTVDISVFSVPPTFMSHQCSMRFILIRGILTLGVILIINLYGIILILYWRNLLTYFQPSWIPIPQVPVPIHLARSITGVVAIITKTLPYLKHNTTYRQAFIIISTLRCPRCDMLVPLKSLDGPHTTTDHCDKGWIRKDFGWWQRRYGRS